MLRPSRRSLIQKALIQCVAQGLVIRIWRGPRLKRIRYLRINEVFADLNLRLEDQDEDSRQKNHLDITIVFGNLCARSFEHCTDEIVKDREHERP